MRLERRHLTPALLARFDSQCATQPSGCIEWQGCRDGYGYGMLWVPGLTAADSGHLRTHRIAYVRAHGPIEHGHFICHRCDNPPCCNPDHLFSGTQKANVEDRDAKGRTAIGERNGKSRFTAGEVTAIRAEVAAGLSWRVVAELHGCSKGAVQSIVNRATWRDVA